MFSTFLFLFFLSEFDLWLTDRTSIAYTQFHTRMSYNLFLTSLWFQKDNSSETFIISIKNAQNESEIEIWINTNISMSTKRWDNARFDNIRKILIIKIEAKEQYIFIYSQEFGYLCTLETKWMALPDFRHQRHGTGTIYWQWIDN